jgi:hypothetical protein
MRYTTNCPLCGYAIRRGRAAELIATPKAGTRPYHLACAGRRAAVVSCLRAGGLRVTDRARADWYANLERELALA